MTEIFAPHELDKFIGREIKVNRDDICYTHHGKKKMLGVWITIDEDTVLAYIDQIDKNGYARIQAYTTYSEMVMRASRPLNIAFA